MNKEEIVNNGNKAYRREVLDGGKANNFIVGYATCAYEYEKRIADLEQKLEQAEKDLADYQFNYPTIKELQKENAELKDDNMVMANNYSKMEQKFDHNLAKAKELLNDFICYANLDDCNLYIKEQAEQFLKEFTPPKV